MAGERRQVPRVPITGELVGPWDQLYAWLKKELKKSPEDALRLQLARSRQMAANINDRLDGAEDVAAAVQAAGGIISDHGLLTGLGDDDHVQYLLADGTRTLGGSMAVVAGAQVDGVDLSAHRHSGGAGDGLPVTGIRESSGPTDMAMGSIADGQWLKRTGAGIVGASIGYIPLFQLGFKGGKSGTITTSHDDIPIDWNEFSFFDSAIPSGAVEMIVYAGDTSGVGDMHIECYDYSTGTARAVANVGAGGGAFIGPVTFTMPGVGTNAHQLRYRWYRDAGSGTGTVSQAFVYVRP